MRFLENGPNIPDALLERRDQGRCVFLCGAGVSVNSGMPTFPELTIQVADKFCPDPFTALGKAVAAWKERSPDREPISLTPLDQVFHALKDTYGASEINEAVAHILSAATNAGTISREHALISKISCDINGTPQIVTTNFDTLFEGEGLNLSDRSFEPPSFPLLELGGDATGVTYLHGRMPETPTEQASFVLSSADLGRAYLAEGWATSFMRSLLKHYTVVLVGYQAEDPPVKYLLQGLNLSDGDGSKSLFAFDKGPDSVIAAKWRDKGVRGIGYTDHEDLWLSLEGWSERSRDPRHWRSSTITKFASSPGQLAAHERGQMMHIARSTQGARAIANAEPRVSAEWLCVFDALRRTAEPSSDYGDSQPIFDPLEIYGLDDDPARAPTSGRRNEIIHDHVLWWRRGDPSPTDGHGLSGQPAPGHEPMPPRIYHLLRWLGSSLGEPITVWWAMRQARLHPRLVEEVELQLRRGELPAKCRWNWQLILEHQRDRRAHSFALDWFTIKDRVQTEGWSAGSLREMERVLAPSLEKRLPRDRHAAVPPTEGWDEVSQNAIGAWQVKLPELHKQIIEVPDEVLSAVFEICERSLLLARSYLADVEQDYFAQEPVLYSDREFDGNPPDIKDAEYTLWFLELLDRVRARSDTHARAAVLSWPSCDPYIFARLRLYALNLDGIFEPALVSEQIIALEDQVFWDYRNRRELLFLLQDRWESFAAEDQDRIFARMLDGPATNLQWNEAEYPEIRAELGARYCSHLESKGIELTEGQKEGLKERIAGLKEWRPAWASGLTREHGLQGGSVTTDEAPEIIQNLPLSEIVEVAERGAERSFGDLVEKKPFIGLVKSNPRKALAALSLVARKGEYPSNRWSELLRDWPDDVPVRLDRLLWARLARLPAELISAMRYDVGGWMETRLPKFHAIDPNLAWSVFDHFKAMLIASGEPASRSSIVKTTVGGREVDKSRRTLDHAINGPFGRFTEALLSLLNSLELKKAACIPAEIKSRLEKLLLAPGEGGDHTVCVLCRQLEWLHYLDPLWSQERLIPLLQADHSSTEPAWNGFLYGARSPGPELFDQIKEPLLQLFPRIYSWDWGGKLSSIAAEIIVELGVCKIRHEHGLHANETRVALRRMNNGGRVDAIRRLTRIGGRESDGWKNYVFPFAETIWPRERTLRSPETVKAWVDLLENSGDSFPDALKVVSQFLEPVLGGDYWLYRYYREVGSEQPITDQHPLEVLELLSLVIVKDPYLAPRELELVLTHIESCDPLLVGDRRFLNLLDLVERR